MSSFRRRLAGALVPFFLLAACGGGGGGGAIAFTLLGVSPAVSDDLNGGDVVTITGTNFLAADIALVTFGASPGTNLQVLSDTTLTVQTPPAPGGVPGVVTIEVTSLRAGIEALFGAYTYASSGPNPVSISRTTFTPTGAEDFTITGTTLGPLGGSVTVIFQGIGSVTASVSGDGNTITGRAPVSASVPPIGGITVTVDTGAATANVPTAVSYSYTAPFVAGLAGVPYQTQGNASQPVRLADGYAVVCTSGANAMWGDADDDIKIIVGPPNSVQVRSVAPRGAPGTTVGYLSAANSVAAILGPDTFCVYTAGSPALGPGFALVTAARTTPVADVYGFPGINAAPVAGLGAARIGFMAAGIDGVFGPAPANTGDDLVIADFNLALTPPALTIPAGGRVLLAGYADVTPGPGNFTMPFTTDGDTIFVMGTGPNAVRWNADDTFLSHVVSTMTTSGPVNAPSLFGRPIAFSTTVVAGPGAGPNGLAGGGDDTLEVFTFAAGWTRTPYLLGQTIDVATAIVPYARIGNGIAVVLTGPNAIKVYTNPATGTSSTLPFVGTPLLAPLGNGGLVAFGPGTDLAVRTGDDLAVHIDAAATTAQAMSLVPNLFQNVAPLADADRIFAVSPGPDGAFPSGDDTLEVYQSRSLGQPRSATQLPLSALPVAGVTGPLPFVPIGPGWGLLQSPGNDAAFGSADDQLILIHY